MIERNVAGHNSTNSNAEYSVLGFFPPMSLDREAFTNREQRLGRCITVGFVWLEIVHPTRCETSKMITEVVSFPVS